MAPPKALATDLSRTASLTLVQRLRSAAGDVRAGEETQAQTAAVRTTLKQVLAEGRAAIRERFEAGERGMRAARATARLTDEVVGALFTYAVESVFPAANPTKAERLALVAVGGYGRGEMAPSSDIDLLFLLPYRQTPWSEQIVEYMLYVLWDLGLKVGHA